MWSRRRVTLSAAAIIKRDSSITLIDCRTGAVPQIRGISEPHDQQDWLAFALLVPINQRAPVLKKCHLVSTDTHRKNGFSWYARAPFSGRACSRTFHISLCRILLYIGEAF